MRPPLSWALLGLLMAAAPPARAVAGLEPLPPVQRRALLASHSFKGEGATITASRGWRWGLEGAQPAAPGGPSAAQQARECSPPLRCPPPVPAHAAPARAAPPLRPPAWPCRPMRLTRPRAAAPAPPADGEEVPLWAAKTGPFANPRCGTAAASAAAAPPACLACPQLAQLPRRAGVPAQPPSPRPRPPTLPPRRRVLNAPLHTPPPCSESYKWYDLPYCPPKKGIQWKTLGMGEVRQGGGGRQRRGRSGRGSGGGGKGAAVSFEAGSGAPAGPAAACRQQSKAAAPPPPRTRWWTPTACPRRPTASRLRCPAATRWCARRH
jgi:hypothetical protein